MKLYKLTNQNCETYNHTKWGPGITHETDGQGELCGSGWIHAYTHPLLAMLLDPIYGNFNSKAKLWECNGNGKVKKDYGLKIRITRLTTKHQIKKPQVTIEQRVRWGILCALEVYQEQSFQIWAEAWLTSKDRSETTAWAAEAALWAAAKSTARAAGTTAWAAARAAEAATRAAWAVAGAIARAAAQAAAWTARIAAMTDKSLDLIGLAKKAMEGA